MLDVNNGTKGHLMPLQKNVFDDLSHRIQWGSEIRTILDFEWSKRGWISNGFDFEWDLKAQPFKICTNGRHFVKTHLKSGQKC